MSATLNDIVSRRPTIRSISIPEVKKRKEPNKYYVYKILVEWSNDTKTVVYRRYSAFFDFNIKLQELYSSLQERNPSFKAHLPEIPGKILFGRSQIHQVAEKRRGKIEEYSQQLLTLPVELSSSGLVLGFFSTWQDDNVFSTEQSSSSSGDRPPSPLSAATFNLPSVSAVGTLAAGSIFSVTTASLLPAFPVVGTQGTDTLGFAVGHPDEMENLEQYKVIADYERKDSHQVTLHAGQIVHVIEKHDTGWWMVMAEDEQGYAPAAHLEPLEGSHYDHLTAEDASVDSSPGYEALENYTPQSEDEVGFKAGDKVEVLTKSMDGWWKIRVNNKVGFSPSTLIHKGTAPSPIKAVTEDPLYETGGALYEGLHMHRPPPRRNTVCKRGDIDIYGSLPEDIYALPRTDNVWVKTAGDENSDDVPNGAQYYKIPRSIPAPIPEEECKGSGLKKEGEGPKMNHTQVNEAGLKEEEVTSSKGFPQRFPGDPASGKQRSGMEGSEGDARPHLPPTPVGVAAKGKVEVDEYVFMADQQDDEKDSGQGTVAAVTRAAVVMATQPVSSPQMASRHPLNPASSSQPTTRLRSLSEDRLLSGTTKNLQAPPPRPSQAPPPHSSQTPPLRPPVPPQQPDEYVDMSNNDNDPTYAVPPDALMPEEDTDVVSTLLLGTGVRASQDPTPTSTSVGSHKSPHTQPRPSPASSRSSSALVQQRSAGSSPPGVRKEPQTPPIKAPKPTNKIKVGDAVMEVESKADLHDELRQKFGQKSRSATELEVSADTSDPKVKPMLNKKKLFGSKDGEGTGVQASPTHKPLEHTISSPVPLTTEAGGARVFVAHCDYTSQTEGCLSFSKGDRCALVKNTPGGWWMVSINGKEGWTPSDYWDEDVKVRQVRPLPIVPADKKPKEGRGVMGTVAGTTAELPSLTPSATSGGVPGTIPPPSLDNDKQLSDNIELKKACPSVSAVKAKPSVPTPFKKNTPEKPVPQSRPTKPVSSAPPGAPVAPVIKNGEMPIPPLRHNGELPPGGVANGALVGGRNGDPDVEGHDETQEGVGESEYSLLSDVLGESSDFRNAQWFVGKMEREKAEQVLKEYGRQREFLVRERVGKDGYFAISIRHHYSFKHFNIDPTNDGKYSMGPLVFGTLDEIVTHYQSNSLFIHDGQHVTLGQPVKLKNRGEKPS